MRCIREAWQCDCDGVSHEARLATPSAQRAATRAMAGEIEKLTGYRPPACPWRAFYSPIVTQTVQLAIMAEKGLGMAELDDDPPAIWLDAIKVYLSSYAAVRNHDAEVERKKREAERNKR